MPPQFNPFSSRYVEPGAIRFRFANSGGIPALVEQLRRTDGWGEIVGPHGSGKSTLLAALLPALAAWSPRLVRLNTTHRVLPADVWKSPPPGSLQVIDGYEQLGFFTRQLLQRHCRRKGCGLLVTAHRPLGLPTLYRTEVELELAHNLIATLLPPGCEWVLQSFPLRERLRQHQGNLREVLFELYDRWELGRQAG